MRRSVKLGVYGAVLAGIIGGTTAWALVDKTVTVSVDGTTHTVHTMSGKVRDAVAETGYEPTARDSVKPALSHSLHDGDKIVVERGRLIALTLDGTSEDRWVTARTVGTALTQLKISPSSWVSAPLATALPLATTRLEVRTPKSITIVVDGVARTVFSTDSSALAAVSSAEVSLNGQDELSVDPNAPLAAGMAITVHRVSYADVVEQEVVPFNTVEQADDSMDKGSRSVVTYGRNGSADTTYRIKYVDGQEAGRTVVAQNVTKAATDQVVKVGSKVAPAAPPASVNVDPGSAQDIAKQMMLRDYGWGDDQFSCLYQLWARESGWRVNAGNQSSGAYGIPQALPGSKMAAFGADWQTNPATQIAWGLSYISGRYGTPCGAWSAFQRQNWY